MAATRNHDLEAEISFSDVFDVIWAKRWIVLFVTIFSTTAAGVATLVVHKKYTASITVSAVSVSGANGQTGALGGLSSQFQGLAALAGVSGAGDSKKSEILAVLQSESLTEAYIRENDLLPLLFPKQWDPINKKWKISDPEKVPTLWKANQYFKKQVRSVVTDPKTGLVTVTIVWNDPKLAAQWANGLVRMTNDYLRNEAIKESERNITYLTEQVVKTDVLGVRQAIYSILQNEIEKLMLARGSTPLKVLDSAFVPEIPSSPKLSLWLPAGFTMGLFAALLLAFAQTNIHRPMSRPSL
jgi:uncharacterized protein involved in exopolysaccharide biosynthesis